MAKVVNNESIAAYWNIGRIIVEHEQESNECAAYGKKTLKELSKVLTEEFGKGFMFVGTQQRITRGNEHYYVDMVFYNKIRHSYVLIELKTKKLMPAAVG